MGGRFNEDRNRFRHELFIARRPDKRFARDPLAQRAIRFAVGFLLRQGARGLDWIPAEDQGDRHPENVVRNIKMEISNPDKKTFKLDGKTFDKKKIVGHIF
ncbi:MAG: hypothetical protein II968_01270, partial [Selenomonadaceae bacterium]|nr:hypothetical protein [Selenomonadaceae bacterium]